MQTTTLWSGGLEITSYGTSITCLEDMKLLPWIPKNENDIKKFIYKIQVQIQTTLSEINLNGDHSHDRDRDHGSLIVTTPTLTLAQCVHSMVVPSILQVPLAVFPPTSSSLSHSGRRFDSPT